MKDYYKIGEISKIYNIGRDSLMYYERIGILNPIRDVNEYRLYNISDIWKLNLIKELRALNFSMQKIKEYIDNRSIDCTKEILNEEITLINKKINELENQKNNIKRRLKNISDDICNSNLYKIEVKYINERKALKLNGDISRDEEVDFLVKKLQKEYEDKFYVLGNNSIGAVYNLERIKENIFNEYKAVFCLLNEEDEKYNLILEEGKYVIYTYRGSYSANKKYILNLLQFIKERKYVIKNDPIEIYKIDIHETANSNEFITEIQIPIE